MQTVRSSSSSRVAGAALSSHWTTAAVPTTNAPNNYTNTFTARRSFGATVREAATADDALRFSGYSEIDFTIPEDSPVYTAVQKFAAFNIGCLVTVDAAGA